MKKVLLVLSLFACNLYAYSSEPRLRGYDPYAPDFGLPDGGEVLTGLIIAIIALPVGWLILRTENRTSEGSNFSGCLGVLFIGAGIVCLLPLLAWLCSILSIVAAIGFLFFIALIILGFFSSKK